MTWQFHSEHENLCPHKDLCVGVCNSTIHENGKVETQMWLATQNTFCPYRNTTRCEKGNRLTSTRDSMDESPKHYAFVKQSDAKTTYATILFLWNVQKRQIHADRKQISHPGPGVGMGSYQQLEMRDFLGNVLKLASGDGCVTL